MKARRWLALSGAALLVAAVFALIWPSNEVEAASGLRPLILRWFHPMAWVLLAASFALRATASSGVNVVANGLAATAFVCYLVFVSALVA